MEGAAERRRREMQHVVAQAWWNANLDGAGSKLKPLGHYLDQLKPRKPQTVEDTLASFKALQARGVPVKIRLVKPGNENEEQ